MCCKHEAPGENEKHFYHSCVRKYFLTHCDTVSVQSSQTATRLFPLPHFTFWKRREPLPGWADRLQLAYLSVEPVKHVWSTFIIVHAPFLYSWVLISKPALSLTCRLLSVPDTKSAVAAIFSVGTLTLFFTYILIFCQYWFRPCRP